MGSKGLDVSSCGKLSFFAECVDGQTDLNLCYTHTWVTVFRIILNSGFRG